MSEIEVESTQESKPKSQSAAATRKPDKYADARLAKKKQRRAAHRATIRRSNANG